MKHYNISAKRYNGSINHYNGSDGYAGTDTQINRYGYNRLFSKKNWPIILKPVPVYPFTHLYLSTSTDTAGTGHGYTGTQIRIVPGGFYQTPTRITTAVKPYWLLFYFIIIFFYRSKTPLSPTHRLSSLLLSAPLHRRYPYPITPQKR
jgi:hypothetical protein